MKKSKLVKRVKSKSTAKATGASDGQTRLARVASSKSPTAKSVTSGRSNGVPPTVTPPTSAACAHCGVVFVDGRALNMHFAKSQCGDYLSRAGKDTPHSYNQKIEVNPPTDEQALARSIAMVHCGPENKSAIELRRTDELVTYIPHASHGFCVERKPIDPFDALYKPIADYPTGRAAKLFVGFTLQLGGTSEALAELSNLVHVTDEEKQMAIQKLAGNKSTKDTSAQTAKSNGERGVKAERKPRESAASMFKALIMEGRWTDDEIFAKTQEAFSLSDDKRSYVAWYRNSLKKGGENPPPAKGAAKTAVVAKKSAPAARA